MPPFRHLGATHKEFKAGATICREGAAADCMYIIDQGSVKFYKQGEFLREMKAGDYFGEIAVLLDNQMRTAWVRAKTFCVLAKLSKDLPLLNLRSDQGVVRYLKDGALARTFRALCKRRVSGVRITPHLTTLSRRI